MLKYPINSAQAFAFLFRRYNDIDVYIEDVTYKNIFEKIINRILSGNSKIKSVISLGGKYEVLNACENDQENGGPNRIYIIDGDADYILGRVAPKLKHLYRLKAYSIENLLLSEEGVVSVVYESSPDLNKSEIKRKIYFENWQNSICNQLCNLFISYTMAYHFQIKIKTFDAYSFSSAILFIFSAQG